MAATGARWRLQAAVLTPAQKCWEMIGQPLVLEQLVPEKNALRPGHTVAGRLQVMSGDRVILLSSYPVIPPIGYHTSRIV